MGEVVLCTVSWAIALWTVLRCRRIWQGGADQLWGAKWDALGPTLWVLAYAVMTTLLLPLPTEPGIPVALAALLILGSIGCGFARRAAVRRADADVRAMRAGLGLPTERRMRRPVTLATLWGMTGVLVAAAWLITATSHMTSRPTTRDEWPEMDSAINTAVMIAVAFLAAGALHAVIQEVRTNRDRRRVRNADRQYIGNGDA